MIQDQRVTISYLLGLSQESYELMIMERAFQYIETNISTDYLGADILMHNDMFWEWWNNQWDNRNTLLIGRFNLYNLINTSDVDTIVQFLNAHEDAHSLRTLSSYPTASILDDSYAILISKIFKQNKP